MCKSTKKVSKNIENPTGFLSPTLFNLTGFNHKDIEVRFNAEQVSNDGGLLLLKEVENQIQAFWIDDLMQSTQPLKHYHIIFTLPHILNAVCLHNHRMYYGLLFDDAWNTLRSFGYSHFGTETGAVAVLHTWGQNLSLHPHVHCIVPATGYTLDGRWKNIGHSWNYLYPVHQLSEAFKAKFLDSLKRALRKQNELSVDFQRCPSTSL